MNMKWITLLIMSAIVLTGCSDTRSVENDAIEAVAETTTEQGSEGQEISGIPERKAEVYGVVNKIIGNEVSIKLIERLTENEIELTEAEKEAKKAARQLMSTEEKQADKDLTMILTNEIQDVIIPVGTEIVIGSGNGTDEFTNLELLDINKGTTIKIWLIEGREGEISIAEYVQILSN